MSNQLAAVSPTELVTAQSGVLEHCAAKINKLEKQLVEAQAVLKQARESCFNTAPFRRRVNALTRKVAYYKKIGQAVNKGYLIIPDVWNSDMFAIRVKDANGVRWSKYGISSVQKLDLGEGIYVDAKPIRHTEQYEDANGNERTRVIQYETDDEIDFPVTAVHPAVIEATKIAMADRVFDSFGIARAGGDPFILGEIRNPANQYSSITFFIAWFLDVESI